MSTRSALDRETSSQFLKAPVKNGPLRHCLRAARRLETGASVEWVESPGGGELCESVTGFRPLSHARADDAAHRRVQASSTPPVTGRASPRAAAPSAVLDVTAGLRAGTFVQKSNVTAGNN